MRQILPLIAAVMVVFVFGLRASAVPDGRPNMLPSLQPDAAQDVPLNVGTLDERLQKVEDRNPGVIMVFVLLLFAFFCGLWAQNTNRNPWLWFFLGLIFSIITAFVVLHKNTLDLQTSRTSKPKPKS